MRSLLLLSLLLGITLSKSIVEEYYEAVERFSFDGGNMLRSSSPSSLKAHFLAFTDYKNTVEQINADPNCPFKAEINKFSIMTESERSVFGSSEFNNYAETIPWELREPDILQTSSKYPAFVNWATRGVVGPVKDQDNKKCRYVICRKRPNLVNNQSELCIKIT